MGFFGMYQNNQYIQCDSMFAEVVSTLKDKNLHSMLIMACKKKLKQYHKFTSEQTHKKLAIHKNLPQTDDSIHLNILFQIFL